MGFRRVRDDRILGPCTTREAGERYQASGWMFLSVVTPWCGKWQSQEVMIRAKSRSSILTRCCCDPSADVVRAYYTLGEIILPIIKKHHEQFPPSTTTSTPGLPSSPLISCTLSVTTQPAPVSPPKSKSTVWAPVPRLDPYGPAYGKRVAIEPKDTVWRRGRTPLTPSSPGFGGGYVLGALFASNYKNMEVENKKSKDGRVMPKVMMTLF